MKNKTRYFTETLTVGQRSAMHEHGTNHWFRINANVIFGFAELIPHSIEHLQDHETVALLPSMYDNNPLEEHFKSKHSHHHDALKQHLNLPAKATMQHIISALHKKGYHAYIM
jgi:hypothetical protein